jgi:lipopolysaccharide export system permease protein
MPTSFSYFKLLTLDFYILKNILNHFLASLAFIVFVFLSFQSLRLAEFFVVHAVSGELLFKMTGLLILSFLPNCIPVAFLISLLMGLGKMSTDHELVACFCCGLSLRRLTLGPIVLASLLAGALFFLENSLCPWGEREYKSLQMTLANTKVVSIIREKTFTTGFFDLLVYASEVDEQTDELKGVFVYDDRPIHSQQENQSLIYVAQKARLISQIQEDSVAGVEAVFELTDGSLVSLPDDLYSQKDQAFSVIDFKKYELFLKIDEASNPSALGRSRPRQLSAAELKTQIESLSPSAGRPWLEYWIEFHRRIALIVAPLCLVFLAMPLCQFSSRHVKSQAILIGLLVVVGYWVLQALVINLVLEQIVIAPIAMQLPNAFVVLVGILSHYVRKYGLFGRRS